ncbi:hypothetical protein, partial [Herbidospora sp. RD11066]
MEVILGGAAESQRYAENAENENGHEHLEDQPSSVSTPLTSLRPGFPARWKMNKVAAASLSYKLSSAVLDATIVV